MTCRRTVLLLGLVVLVVCGGVPAVAHAQSERVEYYATDAIGSVRVVFDASGNILGRMDYGPFGMELRGATGMPTERFAGLTRDGEAGLDYAQARMYQVRTGRFTAPDPVYAGMFDPQRWNRYSYAVNSPFSFTDSSGLETQTVNCGLGAYWCPGTIRTKPDDIDKYFDPRNYGYQGGEEAARAEAQYASTVTSAWASGAAAAFGQGGGGRSTGSTPSVATSTQVVLPDGRRVTVKDGGMLRMAREASSKAEPLTRPQVYGEILGASIAGGVCLNVCGPGYAAAQRGTQTVAIALEMAVPGTMAYFSEAISSALEGSPPLVTNWGGIMAYTYQFLSQAWLLPSMGGR